MLEVLIMPGWFFCCPCHADGRAVVIIVWGSQCDGNSGENGDLENFGRAVITKQLQTLTMPTHHMVLTNMHWSSLALFLTSMAMVRTFDANRDDHVDMIKVSIVIKSHTPNPHQYLVPAFNLSRSHDSYCMSIHVSDIPRALH